MLKSFLICAVLFFIVGCDDVPGQYRHDDNHHNKGRVFTYHILPQQR